MNGRFRPAGDAPTLAEPRMKPIYFICEHGRDGRASFNFAAQLRAAAPMQVTLTLTRGLLILAASILLLSHPHWFERFGRRRAQEVARELAVPFAQEYLIPNVGRDWIISSSTVREFAAELLGEDLSSGPVWTPSSTRRTRRFPISRSRLHRHGGLTRGPR